MTDFRAQLADRAIARPQFFEAFKSWEPHPELVRIADSIRDGRSLKEIAIHAWTYQDSHDLPIMVAARMRTIFRRVHRHLNQSQS